MSSIEAIDREINAVNAEFAAQYYDDTSRVKQVYRSAANPNHVYHKWGMGSRRSLSDLPKEKGIDVHAALRKHFSSFYSANVMKLVVLGAETLDTLEGWVAACFSSIPDKQLQHPNLGETSPPVYLAQQLPLRLDIEPLNDLRHVRIEWALQAESAENNYNALFNALAYLFGDEGPGSIIEALRKRGLGTALWGRQVVGNSSFSSFGVLVTCTSEGIAEVDAILQVVLAYIEFLKRNLEKVRHVFYELSEIQLLRFMYPPNTGLMLALSEMARRMHNDKPISALLSSQYLIEFTADVIQRMAEMLEQFTPDRMIVGVVSKDLSFDDAQSETWFGTSYRVSKVDPATYSGSEWAKATLKIAAEMACPEKNTFIPRNESIKTFDKLRAAKPPASACATLKKSATMPKRAVFKSMKLADILDSTGKDKEELAPNVIWPGVLDVWRPPLLVEASECSYLWVKQDLFFQKPHATVAMAVTFSDAVDSVKAHVFLRFYKALMNDVLLPVSFYAANAGYGVELVNISAGLRLLITGFNDKIPVVLKAVLQKLVDIDAVPQERFQRMKEELESSWQDWTKSKC